MLVAVAVNSDSEEAKVADRFARSPYLAIADIEGEGVKEIEFVENPGKNAMGGAAVKTIQFLYERGVKAVVGPGFGPNAMAMLEELGMSRITLPAGTPLREALSKAARELR